VTDHHHGGGGVRRVGSVCDGFCHRGKRQLNFVAIRRRCLIGSVWERRTGEVTRKRVSSSSMVVVVVVSRRRRRSSGSSSHCSALL